MEHTGFIRLAALAPALHPADPAANAGQALALIQEADAKGAAVALLPELSLTGCSCGDLFFSRQLLDQAEQALLDLVDKTKNLRCAFIAGLPLRKDGRLYNCAVVVQRGRIMGIVPKTRLSASGSRGERRHFSTPDSFEAEDTLFLGEGAVPFGPLLFRDEKMDFTFAVTLGQETPLYGGCPEALFNPTAIQATAGWKERERERMRSISAGKNCCLISASAGPGESTTDDVFAGCLYAAEAGEILASDETLDDAARLILADMDLESLQTARLKEPRSGGSPPGENQAPLTIPLLLLPGLSSRDRLLRRYSPTPFHPDQPQAAADFCRDIFHIQTTALAQRLRRTGNLRPILGVSGGSDSTLALLVAAAAVRMNDQPPSQVLAVTMPGPGTTKRTFTNAYALMEGLGCQIQEISIQASLTQHMEDIDHDPASLDVTYENAQARERTQILMDLANKERGLVVGTGDLSELALGWTTYNGDHMSMYGVNAGLPKCLVRLTIATLAQDLAQGPSPLGDLANAQALARTLNDVLATPISPELLPPDEDGNIAQQTEHYVGPYQLHDFFLYHCIHRGMRPERVLFIAADTFAGSYELDDIRHWLNTFLRRFFSQQFKRNCMPEGPRLIDFSFSPRGHWLMAGDLTPKAWLTSDAQD